MDSIIEDLQKNLNNQVELNKKKLISLQGEIDRYFEELKQKRENGFTVVMENQLTEEERMKYNSCKSLNRLIEEYNSLIQKAKKVQQDENLEEKEFIAKYFSK